MTFQSKYLNLKKVDGI